MSGKTRRSVFEGRRQQAIVRKSRQSSREFADSGTQTQFAFRSGDVGAKPVSIAVFDACFDSDVLKGLG